MYAILPFFFSIVYSDLFSSPRIDNKSEDLPDELSPTIPINYPHSALRFIFFKV